jgi:hypothetical protein
MNLHSSWSIISDGTNRFFGRKDGLMFMDTNVQITSDVVDLIRNYHSGNKTVTETLLDQLNVLNIRRDSTESYYLIPLVIFILKEYIDWIQR